VTVAPEDKRIAVLRRGTSKAFIVEIPTGGQRLPTSTVGTKEEWKKAQKKEIKKKTSEIMNHNIPIFKPFWTIRV